MAREYQKDKQDEHQGQVIFVILTDIACLTNKNTSL